MGSERVVGFGSQKAMRRRWRAKRLTRCLALLTASAVIVGACGGAGPKRMVALEPQKTASDQMSVTVSWAIPDTDREITGFALRWRRVSETDWQVVDDIPNTVTTYLITGLLSGTEYEIEAGSVFSSDAVDWSLSITVMTDADPLAIRPPAVPELTPGETSVAVSWTAPETVLVIVGHDLRWRRASAGELTGEVSTASTETTYLIENLDAGAEYEVAVRAEFDIGNGKTGHGQWSPWESVTTTSPSTPPTTPMRRIAKIYWAESIAGDVHSANLDGTGVERLHNNTGDDDPSGIALDLTARKLYWVGTGDVDNGIVPSIKRADLNGLGIESVIDMAPGETLTGIAIDDSHVYWTQDNKIRRADLDGSNPEDVVSVSGSGEPTHLALASGKIYWTEHKSGGGIMVANQDGTGSPEALIEPLQFPYGIAVDIANGRIYWTETDSASPEIKSAKLDGTDSRVIHDSVPGEFGSAPHGITVFEGKVYWVDYRKNTIESVFLDGSGHEVIIVKTPGDGPSDLAIGR